MGIYCTVLILNTRQILSSTLRCTALFTISPCVESANNGGQKVISGHSISVYIFATLHERGKARHG